MNCKRLFKIIRIKVKRHTHCDMSFFNTKSRGSTRLAGLLCGVRGGSACILHITLLDKLQFFSKRGIQILKNVLYLYYKGGNAHGC